MNSQGGQGNWWDGQAPQAPAGWETWGNVNSSTGYAAVGGDSEGEGTEGQAGGQQGVQESNPQNENSAQNEESGESGPESLEETEASVGRAKGQYIPQMQQWW